MTKQTEQDAEREAFEAWFSGAMPSAGGDAFRRDQFDPESYGPSYTQVAWMAWQARAAVSTPEGCASFPDGYALVPLEQFNQLIADYNVYIDGKAQMPWNLFRLSLAEFFEVAATSRPTPKE